MLCNRPWPHGRCECRPQTRAPEGRPRFFLPGAGLSPRSRSEILRLFFAQGPRALVQVCETVSQGLCRSTNRYTRKVYKHFLVLPDADANSLFKSFSVIASGPVQVQVTDSPNSQTLSDTGRA